MSTYKAYFGGIAGLEEKKEVTRPEKCCEAGLEEENIIVGPARRNYVNP
mgnify:CR=1 FL=1